MIGRNDLDLDCVTVLSELRDCCSGVEFQFEDIAQGTLDVIERRTIIYWHQQSSPRIPLQGIRTRI
jgi:hypothetical protein